MLWLAALGLARAGCDNTDLQDQLALARTRYASQDEAGFRGAMEAAERNLSCLDEPLRRPTAAEWHRASALEAAVSGGPDARERVVAALRAGLELDPTLALFPGALPEAYWAARYEEARALVLAPSQATTAGVGARLSVDGDPAAGRRVELPAVLQCSNSDGAINWTRALGPGEAAPPCEAAPRVAVEPVVAEPEDACGGRLSRGASLGLLGGALALGGASAGLSLWNAAAWEDYLAVPPGGTEEELLAARRLTNGTLLGAATSGALALGAAGGLAWKGCF